MSVFRSTLPLAGLLFLGACATRSQPAEPAPAPAAPVVTVYRTPTCGCCARWEAHLEREGFTVEDHVTTDLPEVRARFGISASEASCHTGVIDGYAIEGHVPASAVRKLLAEHPDARGLTVPGMVAGSPGMEVPGRSQPYDVLLVEADGTTVPFVHYTP